MKTKSENRIILRSHVDKTPRQYGLDACVHNTLNFAHERPNGQSLHEMESIDDSGGLYLRDLVVSNQICGSCSTIESPSYGWRLYYKPYRVERSEAEWMAKTLARIERKVAASSEKLGHYKTYGQYVNRIAIAVGVSHFEFNVSEEGEKFKDWRHINLGLAVDKLDRMERELLFWARPELNPEKKAA